MCFWMHFVTNVRISKKQKEKLNLEDEFLQFAYTIRKINAQNSNEEKKTLKVKFSQ